MPARSSSHNARKESAPDERSPRQFASDLLRRAGPGFALVAITLIAYWPVLDAGFVWDDDANVTHNLALRTLAGLVDLWLEPGVTTQYYPLVYTTFWLEYALWGLEPMGYHATNLALHTGVAVLLWRVAAQLGIPGAWWAAAVFALHPVHVESVAWVTERKNVLSGVFYLGSALVYLRWSDAGPRPLSYRGWAAAFGLYLAALLAKVVTASLPAALLLVAWWRRGAVERRDVVPLLPFFAAAVPIGLLTLGMERHLGVFLEWE